MLDRLWKQIMKISEKAIAVAQFIHVLSAKRSDAFTATTKFQKQTSSNYIRLTYGNDEASKNED
jgi:hypothetical protein